MRGRLALPISAGFIVLSFGFPAATQAGPTLPSFPTYEACLDYIWNLRRGNHALFCEWNGSAWQARSDDDYRKSKKPK